MWQSTDRRVARLCICGMMWAISTMPTASLADQGEPARLEALAKILQRAIASNLEIQAARAGLDSLRARLAGSRLPLNNPQLEFEAEQSDVETYRLGISQTIDWHDKQAVLSKVAETELHAAEAELAGLELNRSAELLKAIGAIWLHSEIDRLATRRIQALEHFTRLVEQRRLAGDIPQADLELARLALTEAVLEQADHAADLAEARQAYFALSGERSDQSIRLPEQLPDLPHRDRTLEEIAGAHPQVRSAHLAALTAHARVQAIAQENRPDPNLGLVAGREDDQTILGVRVSLPLQLRNRFQAQVQASQAETIQAEQVAMQAYRKTLASLIGAEERYRLISRAWSVWISQGLPSLSKHARLLENQWHAGESSTTDYLLQVKQSLDTRIAGTRMEGRRWNVWVEWLSASDSLQSWLAPTAREE